jgi:uncharacterized protein YjbI with pentapeptide repeats
MPEDYSGKNLRGRCFKNQDLTGANFSYADIRGVNFTNTKLVDANFSHAKAGLQKRWTIVLVILSLFLSALSALISGFGSYFVALFFLPSIIKKITIISGVVILILIAVFFFFVSRQGVAAVDITTISITLVVAHTIVESVTAPLYLGFPVLPFVSEIVLPFVSEIIVLLLTIDIARCALASDEKYAYIRTIRTFAIAFAATGGTNFQKANLTDANFTKATLKNTNFREAILTRTCWKDTQKLDLARVGDSILAKPAVRNLLVSGNGYKKSYIGENLKGANLTGVNLNQANLKEADISEATLYKANLEAANLTKSQAIGTDFTHAYLTGACLEAWNIDSTTKLEDVDCLYVYLLEHPDKKGNRERRPHDPDKVFEAGDFAKLYKKIMNTVQILLRNGINPEAFTIAFRKLMEENPEITPDSIQAIEKKGDDVLLTLEVPEGTDKGKVQRNFESVYEARLEAQKQTALLEAEIRHNQDLKDVIETLTHKPSANSIFQITNAPTAESKAMNQSSDQSRNFTAANIGGDFKPIGSALNSDYVTISGTVAEAINQLPVSTQPDKPGIKELLTELQAAIEAETNLSAEDKAEALEQVKALAEAGKNPQEGAMQKAAKTAMKILKGTVTSLPAAATLYEACQKLLPAIAQLLSLA